MSAYKPYPDIPSRASARAAADPHLWLEEVEGKAALDWVKGCNSEAIAALGDPSKSPSYDRLLAIMDSKDKIPGVTRIGNRGYLYNFWQDDKHVQGIWRRTTLESYRTSNPIWTTVIDVDAIPPNAKGDTWVWHNYALLDEGLDGAWDRALVFLSPGGSDADTMREFDLVSEQFISVADGGFEMPNPAKSSIAYRSRDELLIGSDFGPSSLTSSGYPRIVKSWKRGTPVEEAVTVFEGEHTDVAVSQYCYHDRGVIHEIQHRSLTFYTSRKWYRSVASLEATAAEEPTPFVEIPVPHDVSFGTFGAMATIELRSDWKPEGAPQPYKAGSLLSTPIELCMRADWSKLFILFEPSPSTSLQGFTSTCNYLVLSLLCDVKGSLRTWKYNGADAGGGDPWTDTTGDADAVTAGQEVSVSAVWPDTSDELWVHRSGFLTPGTLELGSAVDTLAATETLKSKPHMFDTSSLKCDQFFATSLDGTKIPYFVIGQENMPLDGSTPTLLDGYGGFEISMTPYYSAGVGAAWLERGGVKVIANIRGGGEYGPTWHQAALKEKRHKAYEDFEAVGHDLIDRGIASTQTLACIGGSNGGLLVGNMLTREGGSLFAAIVCQVPLLDMKRYSQLLAGASWMAEYGDPSTSDWSFLRSYSAYHCLRHDCLGISDPSSDGLSEPKPGWTCPRVLFTTSTKDDRVHPGHARKMVKVLKDEPATQARVLYWENTEGGHGGAADNKQRAYMWAMSYNFLAETLGLVSSRM